MTSPTTNPLPSGTHVSLQLIPPKTLEFKVNGTTYEIIKIRQRVGGKDNEWQEIDLSKLTDPQKDQLVRSAETTSDVFNKLNGIPSDLLTAHTFTLQFNQDPEFSPSLFQMTIGKIFSWFAWKPEPFILQEITYKTSATSKEKTFKPALEKYDAASQNDIVNTTYPLAASIKKVVKNHLHPLKAIKKTTPSSQPAPAPQPSPQPGGNANPSLLSTS